jgi:hypothetical protein
VAILRSTLAWFLINPLPPIVACHSAFVAELPGSNGVVLKIGHFDEVAGVTPRRDLGYTGDAAAGKESTTNFVDKLRTLS